MPVRKTTVRYNGVPESWLWKGPQTDGVTQSLLQRFLACRERFRIHALEGLRPADNRFNKRLEFGNLWHALEEAVGGGDHYVHFRKWVTRLQNQYPIDGEDIAFWEATTLAMWEVYVPYWSRMGRFDRPKCNDPRAINLPEFEFRVNVSTPRHRHTALRGKIDGILTVPGPSGKGIRYILQENKTKADIDELAIAQQLKNDFQTMFYMVAARRVLEERGADPSLLRGVRYNVIRRPFSGGLGSIRQKQPTKSNPRGESKKELIDRLINDYIAPEPHRWFMSWDVTITPDEVQGFERRTLMPILEQLGGWWEYLCANATSSGKVDPFGAPGHWMTPYGLWNPLDDGGTADVDGYLMTGSTVGLERAETLFPELSN